MWLLQGSGEAHEVLSWRQGVVRDARLLPSPETGMEDLYLQKRPLMAVCDAAGSETQFCSVGLISLRTGEQVSRGGEGETQFCSVGLISLRTGEQISRGVCVGGGERPRALFH